MAFLPHPSLLLSLGALSLHLRHICSLLAPSHLSDYTVSPSKIDSISLIFLSVTNRCFMTYVSCDRTHMLQGHDFSNLATVSREKRKFFFHTDSVLGSP
uniref:Secreted protein n=1 Tax=Colobus angolensis palliatus TaxID=336983 RepID=A0A2K5IKT8_COLAP